MNQAKPTPGPWVVLDPDELDTAEKFQDPFGVYGTDADEQPTIKVANIMCSDPDITGDQIKGNALLIASAPELLAALKLLMGAAAKAPGGKDWDEYSVAEMVIDKATNISAHGLYGGGR